MNKNIDLLIIFSVSSLLLCCRSNIASINSYTGDATFDITSYENTAMVVVVPNEPVSVEGIGSEGAFISGRTVVLSPYKIGCYEVTQQLYFEIMGYNPSNFLNGAASGEKQQLRPIEWVSWYQAITFCNKLSLACKLRPFYIIDGVDFADFDISNIPQGYNIAWENATFDLSSDGYRLPTEAEWEYAVRGADTTSDEWMFDYPSDADATDCSWNVSNSDGKTHSTGMLKPNSIGLYDCCGNVWEWCFDKFGEISTGEQTDPIGDATSDKHVLRGGCWIDKASLCTVYSRKSYFSYDFSEFIGFRLARSILDESDDAS